MWIFAQVTGGRNLESQEYVSPMLIPCDLTTPEAVVVEKVIACGLGGG